MRVAAGPFPHHASDGTLIHVDQRVLGREQVDLLLGVLRRNNKCPSCTVAVELDEGGLRIEHLWGDPHCVTTSCDHTPNGLLP